MRWKRGGGGRGAGEPEEQRIALGWGGSGIGAAGRPGEGGWTNKGLPCRLPVAGCAGADGPRRDLSRLFQAFVLLSFRGTRSSARSAVVRKDDNGQNIRVPTYRKPDWHEYGFKFVSTGTSIGVIRWIFAHEHGKMISAPANPLDPCQ